MKKAFVAVVLLFSLCIVSTAGNLGTARGENDSESLNKYLAALKKDPWNQNLREKIINLVRQMNPKPEVPAEAVCSEVSGGSLFEAARAGRDFMGSAAEYEKALLIAPWRAADYCKSAVAYEKAGRYGLAVRNYKYYLLAAPNAPDSADIKSRIERLKAAGRSESKKAVTEILSGQNNGPAK